MTIISVLLPIRTVSEANLREHWGAKARRAKSQRGIAKIGMYNWRRYGKAKKLTITIIRIGARKLDPDNLANSSKHVQDGIADALGVDDGADKITWRYKQEMGKPYSIRVEMEAV